MHLKLVWLVVAGVAIGGCCRAISKEHQTNGDSGTTSTASPAITKERPVVEKPEAVVENFFEASQAKALMEKFKAKLGTPVLAIELVLYPSHAMLEAQDRNKLENVDRYTYVNGAIQNADPMRVHETAAQISKKTFRLEEVPLDRIAEFAQRGIKEVGVEDAKVSHIMIERDRSKLVIRVYAGSERRSGFVEFDPSGKIIRVSKG